MAAPVRKRSRNGQQILPVIYIQPPSKTQRLLPFLVVGSCGVWIFAMGALLEHLPDGGGLPLSPSSTASSASAFAFMSTTPTPSFTLSGSGSLENKNFIDPTTSTDHNNNVGLMDPSLSPTDATDEKRTTPRSNPPQDAKIADVRSTDTSDRQQGIELSDRTAQGNHIQNDAWLHQHSHDIPNVLIFTHKVNLLTYKPTMVHDQNNPNNSNAISSDNVAEEEELMALQKNMRHTIQMHPRAQVRFLTDEDCIHSLQAVLGPSAPLIKYFQQETAGMYKADICRGAALWETGGIYLDVDVGVRMPLFEVLQTNTSFATSLVHRDSSHLGNFFQAFMATTPGHAILKRYLHLFLQYYQGTLTRPIKKGPLGVILLRQAFDDVVVEKSTSSTMESEISQIDLKNAQEMSDKEKRFHLGPKLVDTTTYGRIEIWQEILHNTKYMPNVQAPTWGTRRACKFVVVANRKFPLTVPLYSRVEGSRICPANNPNDNLVDAKADTKEDHIGHDPAKSNKVTLTDPAIFKKA